MGKYYGILFIIVLIGMSGAIAYVGDLVGRRMGRKRLSLFGLRPRYTAIVISVICGMLITIVTLALAMALSENVRIGFISVGQLRTETKNLRGEKGRLDREVASLLRGGKVAKEELGKTQRDLNEAENSLKKTEVDLAAVEDKLKTAQEAELRAHRKVAQLQDAESKARGQSSVNQYIAAVFANRADYQQVLFSANQPLDRAVVDPGQTVPMIRKQLESFVEQLDKAVRQAGAKPDKGQTQALLVAQKFVQDPKTGDGGWVPQNKVLDDLAKFIKSNPAPHGLIVEALALRNSAAGEPVLAHFQPFRNELVFHKGTSLGEIALKGYTLPAIDDEERARRFADTYAYLVKFLREKVGPRGKGKVMPLMDPSAPEGYSPGKSSVGGLGPIELFDAIFEVQKRMGAVRVTAVVKEDAWTAGPLQVELRVEGR